MYYKHDIPIFRNFLFDHMQKYNRRRDQYTKKFK